MTNLIEEDREASIDGIRQLADFIEQHPDLPNLIWSIHPDLPMQLTGVVPLRTRDRTADVRAWAEFLGSEVNVNRKPDRTELTTKGQSGDLTFQVVGDVYDWQVNA